MSSFAKELEAERRRALWRSSLKASAILLPILGLVLWAGHRNLATGPIESGAIVRGTVSGLSGLESLQGSHVRVVVELEHGGTVLVRPQPGVGTTRGTPVTLQAQLNSRGAVIGYRFVGPDPSESPGSWGTRLGAA